MSMASSSARTVLVLARSARTYSENNLKLAQGLIATHGTSVLINLFHSMCVKVFDASSKLFWIASSQLFGEVPTIWVMLYTELGNFFILAFLRVASHEGSQLIDLHYLERFCTLSRLLFSPHNSILRLQNRAEWWTNVVLFCPCACDCYSFPNALKTAPKNLKGELSTPITLAVIGK